MIHILGQIQDSLFSKLDFTISNLHPDLESEDYFGHNFQLGSLRIKFRKAKITPRKIGQFVTLWKRNPESKQTEPFSSEDLFDFYIIACVYNEKSGFFFFPKHVLSEKHILTTLSKEGKRGFRVYPNWDFPENKQATKTQEWQKEFFIDFSNKDHLEKLKNLLKNHQNYPL